MLLNQLSRALYEIRSTQKTNIYIYIYIYILGKCAEEDKYIVALNKKIACVEKGLEIGGCTLRKTRAGLGTWFSPPALGPVR